MKCNRASLLMFLSALVMGSGTCLAQSLSTVATTDPVSLGVDFHPGETVRYTFSLKMNLTNRVDPSIPSDKVLSFTPRQYTVEGEIVATLAPAQPGETLHGSVRFQGLAVRNWVSSANLADLEERLRVLEATSITLTTTADGVIALAEASPRPPHDRYVVDAEDLESIAQALLIPRISNQPLAPGQQIQSADFPIPGMVKPGIKLTVLTDYVADVPIARHRSAEVRLSMQVPNQAHPISSQSNSSKTIERYYATGVWTYLLDLDTHQISFLHKTIRTETGYSAESTDSNDPIRIPTNLFTVDTQFEVTARRVAAGASPEREADLTAFEKSLQSPPQATPVVSSVAAAVSPGGETSLGDIARRLRAEREAHATPHAETTPSSGESGGEEVPAGFKPETFPSGDMTVLVPDQASEIQRSSSLVNFRAMLGTSGPIVHISVSGGIAGPKASPDDMFDQFSAGFQDTIKATVLSREKKIINGMDARVVKFQFEQKGVSFHAIMAFAASGGKVFSTTCFSPAADFPQVETLCRTVVESIKAP